MKPTPFSSPRPRPRRVMWIAAIGWVITSLVGLTIALALMKIDRTRIIEAGPENLERLWPYWIASAGAWVGLTAMWLMLRRCERDLPKQANLFTRTAIFILLIAVGVRGAVLMTHTESLSDDAYRYVFDGRNLAAGFNPYLALPGDRLQPEQERWRGERALTPLITYPQLATPYLPVSQLVFGGLGLAVAPQWSDPHSSALVFRTGFVAIELMLMLVLLAALKRHGKSAWWLALYAWHPLAISEIAASGHQDVIGIVFLASSLLAFSVARESVVRWSAFLGLSALGKPFTLPTGLFMLRGRPLRDWITSMITGVTVAAAACAPFWLVWGDHGRAFGLWRTTAQELAEKFAHFGGIYQAALGAVRILIPADGRPEGFNLQQEWLARQFCFLLLIGAVVWICRARMDVWRSTCAMLTALVLLTTTAHPWYLLWGFALVPMANNWVIWTLSLTLPWGYAVLGDMVHWTVPTWVLTAAYAPVFAALLAQTVIQLRQRGTRGGINAPARESPTTVQS